MAASYWDSTQKKYWQFTKEQLLNMRQKLEDEEPGLPALFPLPPIRHLGMFFNQQIVRLGKRLSVRQQALATAQVYVKRFYCSVDIRRTNPYTLLTTAVYLACKMEECPQHIRLVASEARTLFPDFSAAVEPPKLGECEFYLISEMHSQLIVHQPYRTLAALQTDVGLTTDEYGVAWSVVNDHYMTDLPLLYSPHTVAVTAVLFALVLQPSAAAAAAAAAAANSSRNSLLQQGQGSGGAAGQGQGGMSSLASAVAAATAAGGTGSPGGAFGPFGVNGTPPTGFAGVVGAGPAVSAHAAASMAANMAAVTANLMSSGSGTPGGGGGAGMGTSLASGVAAAAGLVQAQAQARVAAAAEGGGNGSDRGGAPTNPAQAVAAAAAAAQRSKMGRFAAWLADSYVDLEQMVDCAQELVSFYECQDGYSEKVTREQVQRFVKARQLDK